MRKLALLTLFVAACSSGDGDDKPPIDARIDAPAGVMCTGAVYDPCTANTQCTSMNCRLFMGDGIQVCTQTCTAGTACPMAGSTAVTCNNMGVCKPPAANNCTRAVTTL
ncbi:MAG: hypothetical protein M4D80_08050 [Myxococcota bacterium]|nr:hypothetical protein [Deltaproteobacteria bacterium]MDQ3335099.1 hypothetical protein [Myxococcota bacterium]